MEKLAKNSIVKRFPIVCVMGHIDHGKSTLLDYIRKTNIVDTEAGGITQNISAYEVSHKTPAGVVEKITFLDTPGHEAFSAMRLSGTSVADIAILVVSAEDGVKKQTLEALEAITNSKIPYVVAISKIDKPGANVEKTKSSLVENGIYIEGYGGSIPCVPISSKSGQGIPELMDMILLVAEMAELKGDPKKPAEGFVIEAHMDNQKGVTSTVIIKDGTIKNGMFVVSGDAIAPTRMMEDFLGKKIVQASFSSPIRIIGFDKLPSVGKLFRSFKTRNEAEEYIAEIKEEERKNQPAPEIIEKKPKTETDETEEVADEIFVRIMIKAEVVGAIKAIEHEIRKIKNDKVTIKIISAGIGNITENDVKLASGRNPATILGFNVGVDASAKELAERLLVKIQTFDIIYKLSEWLAEEVAKKTPKVIVEETTAVIKVLKVFNSMKDKHIIGGRVEKGTVFVGEDAKIMRKEAEIGRGKIRNLQQSKNDTSEVREGVEFGCQFQSDIVPAPGDKLEVFKIMER